MRLLYTTRGFICLAVALYSSCIFGCGGAVPEQFKPKSPVARFDNTDWAFVLSKVATPDGYVRHDLIEKNTDGVKDALYRYVGQIGEVSPVNRPELFPTKDDKLAYYLNAYNATCMYGIEKRGFPGNTVTSGIFFIDPFYYGKQKYTLDKLETTIIRKQGEPRVHFALNCMSASCPALRNEPYDGAKLQAQLAEQGRLFLSDSRGAIKDGDKVKLSEIFKFFTADFVDVYKAKSGKTEASVLDAIRDFAGDDSAVKSAKEFSFQKYDWSLNRPRK